MAMIENEVEKKVYKVEDVQNLLGLGRSKAYEFIENVYYDRKPFRVLKIGRSYRIPCNSFDKWLNGDEERERVRTEGNRKKRSRRQCQRKRELSFLKENHGITEPKSCRTI